MLKINFIDHVTRLIVIFLCRPKGEALDAALSVRLSVRPVPCPANNVKTTVGI